MKKSSLFKFVNPTYIEIQKPLYFCDDLTRPKKEVKRALLEIREEHGKCYLNFSTGTDSIFLYRCFTELVDEGKLTRDAYETLYLLLDPTNLVKNPTYVPICDLEKWRFNYWKNDIDKIFSLAPTTKEIEDFAHANRHILNPVQRNTLIHEFMRSKLDYPNITAAFHGFCYNSKFELPSGDATALYEDFPTLDAYGWDRDSFCSFLLRCVPNFDPSYHRRTIKNYSKHLPYFHTVPETLYGFPKIRENGFKTDYHFEFYHTIPTIGFTGAKMYLPNGEQVVSVEQTQEYFNV
tara:strand:- start:21 stop:896 length:876 start_codon:yes stop_codon:yes gene_type:complete